MARVSQRLHSLVFLFVILTVSSPGTHATDERTYRYNEESEVIRSADGRIRGAASRVGKDFVIGGLFPVHSEDAASAGGKCGEIRSEQLMEAMLFALDTINADSQLLPGIELGYDIRDTCYSENIGLDEALDLIISGEHLSLESCSTFLGGNVSESVATLGIVGAYASRVSMVSAGLGRLFQMPQVSYVSSSPLLNNRDRYSYFYRTISPDNILAKAMVDLMLWFNWTHISTVYSNDVYGQAGTDELQKLTVINDICTDVKEAIDEDFLEEDYHLLAMKLNASAANIVVLYTRVQQTEQILQNVREVSPKRRFIWITTELLQSAIVASRFTETAGGMYGLIYYSSYIQEFHDYLTELTIHSNKRNPWFPEIYAGYAKCNNTQNPSKNACDKNSNITQIAHYRQNPFVSLTIDAVYSFAHALDRFLLENCDQPTVWSRTDNRCSGQKRELNGSALRDYIARVQFHSPLTGNIVQFNSDGHVEGQFDIWNYQCGNTCSFTKVGTWNSAGYSALNFTDVSTLDFGNYNGSVVHEPPESHCGRCVPGQYRRPVTSSCCSICEPCLGQNFSSEHLVPSCNSCSVLDNMWGNNPLRGSDGCVAIAETFSNFSDPWSIVVIIMGILGLLSVAATGIVFGKYYKTPVIKSSSREQMILLLIAIGLSFASVFIYIASPTLGVCIVQRVAIWFCFSLMFGTIMIKILRVFRVFQNKSLIKRPRFMEAYHQIIFSFLVVLGQMVLVLVSIGMQLPGIQRELRLNSTDMNDFPEIVVTCVTDPIPIFVLSGVYETLIIIAACVLGIMSFKYPANYNEAKFIAFCSFALLMIWLAFIPSYFATLSTREIQNATIAFAVIMSAFAVLFCIFGRKLYIVLLRPKENKRQFTSQYTKTSDCTTAIGSLTIESAVMFGGHDPMKGNSGFCACIYLYTKQ